MTAVVFDCDGVLVDSEFAWAQALRESMAKRGVSWANYRHGTMVGGSVPEAVAFMENELGYAVDVEEIGGEIYASVQSIVAAGISPMVGAVELLNVLKGSRPLAVASNGSRETVLASLRAARIPNVVTETLLLDHGETDTRPMPAPSISSARDRADGASNV